MSIKDDSEDLSKPPSLFARATSFLKRNPDPVEPRATPDEGDVEIPADDEAASDLIEVRTERWSVYTEGLPDSVNPTAMKWVIAERPSITYEPRKPEDGDAEYRTVRTPKPISEITPKTLPPDKGRGDWRAGVDPSLLRRAIAPEEKGTQHNDAMSFGRWTGFARKG